LSNLIIINNDDRVDGKTQDAIKYKKDCSDFICLNDATLTKDYRYCELSTQCRQVDVLPNGKSLPMEANYLPMVDTSTGEVVAQELYCTGMHDLRSLLERIEDDKVS